MNPSHNRWVIWCSFALALLLGIIEIPFGWREYRPEFLAVVAIYWSLRMPQYVQLSVILLFGCFQDLLEGVVLGQHALGLMAVCYICILSYQRVQYYQWWQQSILVFVIVGIYQLVDSWAHSLSGVVVGSYNLLLPALTSAILWPLAKSGLNQVSLRFRVT